MGSNWKTARLLDQYDVRSGLSKPAKDFGTGFPFLTFKDVFYNYFTPEVLGDLVESTDKERDGCSVKRGDVFLTRTSETMNELGMSCVALKDYEGATFNGFCKRLRPNEQCDLVPEYVGYYLRSPKFRQAMLAFSTMSTRASLNNEMIGRLEISYPPKEAQRHIAHVLKTLDNKITLNCQINQTLEQMAQALFKSWFVDFDPVVDNALDAGFFEQNSELSEALLRRAEQRKAVREQPNFKPLPAETRQLFPAAFEACEEPSLGLSGWVPKGWGVLQLSKIAKIASGMRPPIKGSLKTKEEPIPVWGGNGIKWFTSMPLSTDNYIITGRVGTLGTVYKVSGQSWASDNALTVRPVADELFDFVYQILSGFDIASLNSGSTQPLVTQTALGSIQFVFPNNSNLLFEYQRQADACNEKYLLNSGEVDILTELRDTLLPKLISGELRLNDDGTLASDNTDC
ncbi:restriction endonuclease subunit S [Vibrio misgurnus]|uniref:restriction endonuclease subunit S n=1 Tax=Vibrio misgurnus TaxID=2993714 RepID=UPI0023F8F96E|nr:restriction endonuclease subunit S [Vibrio sp. VCS]